MCSTGIHTLPLKKQVMSPSTLATSLTLGERVDSKFSQASINLFICFGVNETCINRELSTNSKNVFSWEGDRSDFAEIITKPASSMSFTHDAKVRLISHESSTYPTDVWPRFLRKHITATLHNRDLNRHN